MGRKRHIILSCFKPALNLKIRLVSPKWWYLLSVFLNLDLKFVKFFWVFRNRFVSPYFRSEIRKKSKPETVRHLKKRGKSYSKRVSLTVSATVCIIMHNNLWEIFPIFAVYLGVKTCLVFFCFVAIVRVRVYYVFLSISVLPVSK